MKQGITLLLLLLSLCGFAQVPGYLGKRFSVGYTNNFSPSLLSPNAGGDDLGLNLTHEFNLEYTIKNRTNICLMYQFLNTGTSSFNVNSEGTDGSGNYSDINYSYIGTAPFQLSTKCYGIGFKFFRHGTLAPVGNYKKLDFILYFSELTYDNTAFIGYDNYNGSVVDEPKIGTGAYDFKSFGIGYTIGKQRILFNCLILDYGVRVALLPAGALTFLASENDFIYVNSNDYTTLCRQRTNYRLFGHQLFNFHIGLGFLAF